MVVYSTGLHMQDSKHQHIKKLPRCFCPTCKGWLFFWPIDLFPFYLSFPIYLFPFPAHLSFPFLSSFPIYLFLFTAYLSLSGLPAKAGSGLAGQGAQSSRLPNTCSAAGVSVEIGEICELWQYMDPVLQGMLTPFEPCANIRTPLIGGHRINGSRLRPIICIQSLGIENRLTSRHKCNSSPGKGFLAT